MWLLMHMASGQPARSTEIMGLRTMNTMNGGVRNIFVDQGMMFWVTQYHKGYRASGNTKVIYRFMPRPVSALLTWYMWLVLPF